MESIQWFLLGVLFTLCVFGFAYASTRVKSPWYAWAALIGGALLGTLVGTVIVAQTLYSSTKDHLNEFATLRALGSSSGYIHKVILAQAALSAILGYVLGMSIALIVVAVSIDTSFPIIMTPELAIGLFALTLVMCAASATGAIMKVMKLDPAMVFNR